MLWVEARYWYIVVWFGAGPKKVYVSCMTWAQLRCVHKENHTLWWGQYIHLSSPPPQKRGRNVQRNIYYVTQHIYCDIKHLVCDTKHSDTKHLWCDTINHILYKNVWLQYILLTFVSIQILACMRKICYISHNIFTRKCPNWTGNSQNKC